MKIPFNKIDTPSLGAKNKISRQRQCGYNLIEVMIAALVLSTAILGIAGLQMVGMKGTQQSLMKQQAMGIVQNMIERMRSNQAAVVTGDYVVDSSRFDCSQALPDCSFAACNPVQIAFMDKLNLVCGVQTGAGPNTGGVKVTNANDNAVLVEGTLDVVCRNCLVGDITITVGWKERAVVEGDGNPPVADSLSLNTRIAAP